MSTVAPPKLITIEEWLALPDDGMERDLIQGRLVEKPMTRRNRYHSSTEANIATLLNNWRHRQPERRGRVLSGEAGFILKRAPDSGVGIDVAYISAETAAQQSDENTTMVDGVPVLAVEVLSPNDTEKEVYDKIQVFLSSGVPIVWIVDPHFRTVRVHRPNAKTEFFTDDDELTAEPNLPGLRVVVRQLFE